MSIAKTVPDNFRCQRNDKETVDLCLRPAYFCHESDINAFHFSWGPSSRSFLVVKKVFLKRKQGDPNSSFLLFSPLRVLEACRGVLGASWGRLGAFLGRLESFQAALMRTQEATGGPRKNPRRPPTARKRRPSGTLEPSREFHKAPKSSPKKFQKL